MKNLPSIIAAVALLAVLMLYMCTYQVRSTEVAIIKTFGEAREEPIRVSPQARGFFSGLHFKAPWPIQSVARYDTRIRLLEDRIEEMPTRDSKPLIITTYTGWTISDPYKFHRSYRTVEAGEGALRDRIRTYKKQVVGRHDFSDFVSTRQEERRLTEIEQEMLADLASEARAEFGIDVVLFGIKQLSLPQSVTEAVFETMKATEQAKADNYKAEGLAEADRIVAEAEEAKRRIMAVVERKVADVRAQGLAEVGQLYRRFSEHPELRAFLDRLRSLEEILRTRTEVFLDTSVEPFTTFSPQQRLPGAPLDLNRPAALPAAPAAE